MKIHSDNNITLNKTLPLQQEKTERTADNKTKQTGDSLSLSREAATVREATRAVLAEMDTVRTERIEQLREAIAKGSFKVDPQAVAEAMLKKED
ncbi:MAG: flagellar biosynthesis anti-sigma factor FlgM [Firmicutes bacterium]|nr:flagellar biosynthesis anti-sigma factor FlgM [Bacillota bacterium]HHX75377.1 flagellar biosynthesis anti-sigma factor FlgM [Bacillota bacterium]